MKETLFFLLKAFLRKENYAINFDELKLQLLSHPSYPSLHSITGVLDHFNIDHLALEVPRDIETLKQLPESFISLTSNENGKEFTLVTQHGNSMDLLYGDKKKKRVSLDEFLHIWSGVIVVTEKETVETPDKKVSDTTVSNAFYMASTLSLIGIFFFAKPSLFQSTQFILALIGMGVSFLTVKHELGFQSKALDKICTATETTNCDAVLNSKGASLSKHLKLSDVSFMYFAGLVFSWILSATFSTTATAMIILSILALPVTLYSIYYQFKIVKKWCPLCLGIVTVLWLQSCATFIFNGSLTNIKFSFTDSFILFFSFLVVASLWMFIKPLLKKKQELGKLEIEHHKFKRNFDLFNAVYSKGMSIDHLVVDSKEIVLGNKNAPLNILMVTNPSCFYCKEAHTDMEKILAKNPDDVAITVRFSVPQDKDNMANQVVCRILEIYNTQPIEICERALHEAYKKDVDLNEWLLKWGETDNAIYNEVLKKQKDWCLQNNTNFTPALFINGRQFPKEYNRSDLNYFIEDLIEHVETKTGVQPEEIETVN